MPNEQPEHKAHADAAFFRRERAAARNNELPLFLRPGITGFIGGFAITYSAYTLTASSDPANGVMSGLMTILYIYTTGLIRGPREEAGDGAGEYFAAFVMGGALAMSYIVSTASNYPTGPRF